ncbi:hypothetical protein V6U81_04820 [Micromonospora sp. CPCC 205711]|uniref:hypothetical protein n=1 Tax=Micromonospora sp. CPCC 205547 TaxID=3122400 RepID=UPI002FF0AC04
MSQLTDRLADVVGRNVQAVIVVYHGTFMNSHERVPQALECFLVRGHGLHSSVSQPLWCWYQRNGSGTGALAVKRTLTQVLALPGFGISKVKMKIATGELRSIKDGKYRRILPEWVDDYIREQVERQKAA